MLGATTMTNAEKGQRIGPNSDPAPRSEAPTNEAMRMNEEL